MINDNPQFPLSLTLRIDWSELDLFNHVNNVTYFKYVQASRVNYWEQTGLVHLRKSEAIVPMLLSTQCRFIRPLFYPGNVVIRASIAYIKNSSFGIKHRLYDHNNELVAEAEDVVVLVNEHTNDKVYVPDGIRAKIRQLEGL